MKNYCSLSSDGRSVVFNGKWYVAVVLGVLLLLWNQVIGYLIGGFNKSFLPGVLEILPGLFSIFLLPFVRKNDDYLLGLMWVLWYFVGSLNLVSSSLFLGGYYANLPLGEAAQIYFIGCFVFIIGLLFSNGMLGASGLLSKKQGGGQLIPVGRFSSVLLVAFPFLWVLSMYVTLGYVPVLQGYDITDDIYEINYGPLYPYTIVIALSALYFLQGVLNGRFGKLGWLCFILIVLLSFADSKRVVAMTVMGGAVPLIFLRYSSDPWRKVAIGVAAALSLYVLVSIIRMGWDTERLGIDSITKYMAVGVEFRDFVFSVNNFEPQNVPGYAWFSSGVGSLMNGGLLAIFGYDKTELVQQGSAYVWAHLYGSPFGIRTGLVSELWFAYEKLGFLVIFVFGVLSSVINYRIGFCKSEGAQLVLSGLSGLFLLSIMGQSTGILGSVTVLFYVYVVIWAESIILSVRK